MFVAIVKAFNKELCRQWHNGSCTYFTSKVDCITREEGLAFNKEVIKSRYDNNTERYDFTQTVLEYSDADTSSVISMFKYM